MAHQSHRVDPSFCKLEEKKIEVSLDTEQEGATAADGGSSGEGSLNVSDKREHQDIPDHNDDVIYVGDLNNVGNVIKDKSLGSHQGSGKPQLEGQEKVAAARVPQLPRTRPRIQLGLTVRQQRELEEVFEKIKYPDEFIRYVPCFRNHPSFHPLGSHLEVPSTLCGPSSALSPKARCRPLCCWVLEGCFVR